ncbi:unnamed protein product [Caenorhabditis auriculariae]|uniref:Uncharacterized protein n=1 Tax=Caenorhabditis auriculariae TaxID=2777116 RepID=A0A8S1HUX4_9PELO|nr:unnamed protein product [Caenorhabditis auriculariae]
MSSIFVLLAVAILSFLIEPCQTAVNASKAESAMKDALSLAEIKKSPYYKENTLDIPISTEAGEELFEHWTNQAFAGLISAIATRKMKTMESYDKDAHEKCSKEAKEIEKHAQCLMKLLEADRKAKWLKRRKDKKRKTSRRRSSKKDPTSSTSSASGSSEDWVGAFRMSRAKRSIKVKNMDSYNLKGDMDRSPLGIIAKHIAKTVRILKNKGEATERWQSTVERIKVKSQELKQKKKAHEAMKKRMEVFAHAAKRLNSTGVEFEAPKERRSVV